MCSSLSSDCEAFLTATRESGREFLFAANK